MEADRDDDQLLLEPILFSFAIFVNPKQKKKFPFYFRNCKNFLQFARTTYPESRFVVHTDNSLSTILLLDLSAIAGPERCSFVRYKFPDQDCFADWEGRPRKTKSTRSGHCWLVNAMRFRVLWENSGPETVVVIDIHDNVKVQQRQLLGLIEKLDRGSNKHSQKEIALTYWRSNEGVCQNACQLPIGGHGHFHTDGGLMVWRAGLARAIVAKENMKFAEYCCSVLKDVVVIERGVDEQLFDAFLHSTGIHKLASFQPHVHVIESEPFELVSNDHDGECQSSRAANSPARKPMVVNIQEYLLPLDNPGRDTPLYICREATR